MQPFTFRIAGTPEAKGLVVHSGRVELEVETYMRSTTVDVDGYDEDGNPVVYEEEVERPAYRTWVTMHPGTGAYVTWGTSTSHEEGWSSYSEEITDEGDTWAIETCTDGRDCDGRVSTTRHFTSQGGPTSPEDRRSPQVQGKPARVYDEYAQAMGY